MMRFVRSNAKVYLMLSACPFRAEGPADVASANHSDFHSYSRDQIHRPYRDDGTALMRKIE